MFNEVELIYIKGLISNSIADSINDSISIKIDKQLQLAKDNEGILLWEFYWDCGRMGNVKGVLKATQEEVDDAIGKEVYFGEILDKHSEVYGTLGKGDLKLISDNPVEVANARESGYNPLEYL